MHLFSLKGLVVIEVLTAYPSFAINLVKSMTLLFPQLVKWEEKRDTKKASSSVNHDVKKGAIIQQFERLRAGSNCSS